MDDDDGIRIRGGLLLLLGLIHQYHGDPPLDLLSEENPPLDLFSEEDPPLDLMTSWLKASCGTLEEVPT